MLCFSPMQTEATFKLELSYVLTLKCSISLLSRTQFPSPPIPGHYAACPPESLQVLKEWQKKKLSQITRGEKGVKRDKGV